MSQAGWHWSSGQPRRLLFRRRGDGRSILTKEEKVIMQGHSFTLFHFNGLASLCSQSRTSVCCCISPNTGMFLTCCTDVNQCHCEKSKCTLTFNTLSSTHYGKDVPAADKSYIDLYTHKAGSHVTKRDLQLSASQYISRGQLSKEQRVKWESYSC